MKPTVRAGLIGGAAGCAAMYLLDPDRGARRRALARDKAVRIARKTRDGAEATRRDVANRVGGLRARAARSGDAAVVDDATLQARVRSALGRVTSHPRAIDVITSAGWVTVTGDALASEVPAILATVNKVRGVEGVINDLCPYVSAEGIPSLQGSSDRPDSWSGWIRGGWSPTALLAAGATTAAAALAMASLARRAPASPEVGSGYSYDPSTSAEA